MREFVLAIRRRGQSAGLHPTVKPAAMVADAIMDATARRDIVLDSFLGSGTTLIAAERTGQALLRTRTGSALRRYDSAAVAAIYQGRGAYIRFRGGHSQKLRRRK